MLYEGFICNISSDINNITKNLYQKYMKKYDIINSIKINQEPFKISVILSINDNIYHSFNDDILNIIIIKDNNKTYNNVQKYEKQYDIIYNQECFIYKLFILQNKVASISKKIKKKLEPIDTDYINTNLNLYKFNEIFISIDSNGLLTYYPDSIEYYDINTINNIIPINNTIPSSTTNTITLENILENNGYFQLNINMPETAYVLQQLTLDNNHKTNSSSTSIISSILNWFNPFSYYSQTHITNNTCKYYILSSTQQDNKSSIQQNGQKILPSTYNCILKLHNNKIKILRPVLMLFPIYIENISINDNNNIVFGGKIYEIYKNIDIIYNKYLINPSLYVY